MQLKEFVKKEIRGFWGDEATPETGIPVIKTNNLTYEGVINYADINYRQIDASKIKGNYLQEGDLLIEKSGGTKTHSVGYVSYFDGEPNKFVCNNFILALRLDDEKIRPKFAFYQLKYLYESGHFSHCYRQTTGIQNLQKEQYLGTEIIVPEIAEQDKIIKILDNLTANCEKNSKKLQKFDELIKSQFSELFGGKEFEEMTWRDVVKIVNGKDHKAISAEEGTYPIYGSGGYMNLRCEQFLCNEDSVIIGRKGNISKPLFVKEKFWNVDTAFGIEADRSVMNPYYFYYNCNNYNFEHMNTGTTIPSLTKSQLLELKIKVPSIELQNQFADFVKHIDKLKLNDKIWRCVA